MEIFWRSPIKSLMFDVRVFYFLSYSLQLWSLSLYFPSPSPSILSLTLLLLLAKGGHNISPKEGPFNNYVDQISPNFDPLPPLKWTIVDILHTAYSFSRDPTWTFTDPHSPFSCPRNFWMTPAGIKADISSVTHDMALQLLTFLNVVVVKLHDIFSIGVQH